MVDECIYAEIKLALILSLQLVMNDLDAKECNGDQECNSDQNVF